MGLKDGSVAQFVIFMGVLLHLFALGCHLSFQLFILAFKSADDIEFAANEPFDGRFFDVVSAVYGYEEVVEAFAEVIAVECLYGGLVFDVGFGFLHGLLDSLFVIELLGEPDDFGLDENIRTGYFLLQTYTFQ